MDIAFTMADLLGGREPGAPGFEWRRRNMTAKGNGEFSPWEPTSGNEPSSRP